MLDKKLEKILKYLCKNKSMQNNTLIFRKSNVPNWTDYYNFVSCLELLSDSEYIILDNKNKRNADFDYSITVTLLEKGISYSRNAQEIFINRVISIATLTASIASLVVSIFF